MTSILTLPSRDGRAEPRVLPYGEWLTDGRLSGLGFSAQDIRAIRRGEPIGAVLARQEGRGKALPAGLPREVQGS